MEDQDKLPKEKLQEETNKLFIELEGRTPNESSDKNTLGLIQKAIERGYELGYDKFYTPMCDKCEYRSATCFGPGAFCDECSMENFDEEDEEE